jgi:CheY-like chemotaxis protein
MVRVLLADDDLSMVALLKTLLGMEGFEVATLLDKSGDLLKNIKKAKPDILLMDICMGERNGLTVIRKIRERGDMKDLKVIMVSGFDKADECLDAGADAFLLKPYSADNLIDLLHSQKLGKL